MNIILRITWKLPLLQQYTFGSVVCVSAKWAVCLNNVVDIKTRYLSGMSYHISFQIVAHHINHVISLQSCDISYRIISYRISNISYIKSYPLQMISELVYIFTNNTTPILKIQMPLKTTFVWVIGPLSASLLRLIRCLKCNYIYIFKTYG